MLITSAKLAGGVAVIKVGGATEIAVKERKDRVDDALHAAKVLGKTEVGNDDQRLGIEIVRKAIQSPAC